MSPEASFFCLFVAFIAFVIAAIVGLIPVRLTWLSVGLIAVGLAAWVLVPMWTAVKAL